MMLRALAEGEKDVEKISDYAKGRLKSKKKELQRAAQRRLTTNQRWVFVELLDKYGQSNETGLHPL